MGTGNVPVWSLLQRSTEYGVLVTPLSLPLYRHVSGEKSTSPTPHVIRNNGVSHEVLRVGKGASKRGTLSVPIGSLKRKASVLVDSSVAPFAIISSMRLHTPNFTHCYSTTLPQPPSTSVSFHDHAFSHIPSLHSFTSHRPSCLFPLSPLSRQDLFACTAQR